MTDPTMRSRPAEGYPGRYLSVDAADITTQRDSGWPDFHPEDFCHRCGCQNVSWYIDSDEWNPVMRGGVSTGWGKWQEIICIPCFVEIAEEHHGGCMWRVARDEFGTEVLSASARAAEGSHDPPQARHLATGGLRRPRFDPGSGCDRAAAQREG